MGNSEVLKRSVEHTHAALSEELGALRTRFGPPGGNAASAGPYRGDVPIDGFVTGASRHLHAVNEVLVPAVRRSVPDGARIARDFVSSMRVLEVVLAHVKAHEYGSVYEKRIGWPAVWSETGAALDGVRLHETRLAEALTDHLDAVELEELAGRLDTTEPGEPSRPHPYLPHGRVMGSVTRAVAKRTDRAWDHAEGRPPPWPGKGERKKPGLLGQYLLADPRFDPDEPPETRRTRRPR